jgi:hypothetical protein
MHRPQEEDVSSTAGALGRLRVDIRSLVRDVRDVSRRIEVFEASRVVRSRDDRAEFARWLLECRTELHARGRVLEMLLDQQVKDEQERIRLRDTLRRALGH